MHQSDLKASELVSWCTTLVAEMLECVPASVDPNKKFSRMGLDSAMSVQLIVALEERLAFGLSPDVVADYPTIASLATHLAALCAQRPAEA
jgi:acyl carrier protein